MYGKVGHIHRVPEVTGRATETQQIGRAIRGETDAGEHGQVFWYNTFDVFGNNVTLPIPAKIISLAKQTVPELRSPTGLQELSRRIRAEVGGDRVTGQVFHKEDYEEHSIHATLPVAKPLGEAGKHISLKPASPETHLQAFARGHGAEGGRMGHARDYSTEITDKPIPRGRVDGEMTNKLVAGVGRQAKAMGGGALKKGGMVKGKKGSPVPILAHAGELVVPAEVVPKVLRSSAWIDHVKSIQAKHKISYKDAMKMAKGTYKK